MQSLKQKIAENVKSLSNPQGLLTQGSGSDYLAAFEAIDVGPLEQLLEKDTRNWDRNLKVAKEDAERIEQELQNVIKERQEAEKERTQHMKHFKLAKLPHWGEMVRPSQINFEWPTQDAFTQMGPSCFLKTLEFKKTADGAVSSVRCTYSDTSGSPTFEKATVCTCICTCVCTCACKC